MNPLAMGRKYVSICVHFGTLPLSAIQIHPLLWLLRKIISMRMPKPCPIRHMAATRPTNGVVTIHIPVTSLDIPWSRVRLTCSSRQFYIDLYVAPTLHQARERPSQSGQGRCSHYGHEKADPYEQQQEHSALTRAGSRLRPVSELRWPTLLILPNLVY